MIGWINLFEMIRRMDLLAKLCIKMKCSLGILRVREERENYMFVLPVMSSLYKRLTDRYTNTV